MKDLSIVLLIAAAFSLGSCKKNEAKLIFKFKFDPTQERLDNIGQPAEMPTGHAGQNPSFNSMTAHYLELAPSALTQLGTGTVLYKAEETTKGGETAIDFRKSQLTPDGGTFFEVPLEDLDPGTYEYIRVSLAYQNADVKMNIDSVFNIGGTDYPVNEEYDATLASFVGFNTYIDSYTVKNKSITVNANKKQGYWGFESTPVIYGQTIDVLESGQAPEGATTVVNPLAGTSPIPPGSCVVTGPFRDGKLTITGEEDEDIVVVVSLSTNKSFEWKDLNSNGKWDPLQGEQIVDMGLRGVIPYVE